MLWLERRIFDSPYYRTVLAYDVSFRMAVDNGDCHHVVAQCPRLVFAKPNCAYCCTGFACHLTFGRFVLFVRKYDLRNNMIGESNDVVVQENKYVLRHSAIPAFGRGGLAEISFKSWWERI